MSVKRLDLIKHLEKHGYTKHAIYTNDEKIIPIKSLDYLTGLQPINFASKLV